jgi:hypothetical protein
VLAEFAATDVWDPAVQLRAASVHAADKYTDRFLLELLQNAHDGGGSNGGKCPEGVMWACPARLCGDGGADARRHIGGVGGWATTRGDVVPR